LVNSPDEATKAQVLILPDKLNVLEVCGDDERRELWLHVGNGTIDSFGNYRGWYLSLARSSCDRPVESVKFYMTLARQGIKVLPQC